jgi:dipeptidyl aminopeptidase/acylaminoacyl peptidase
MRTRPGLRGAVQLLGLVLVPHASLHAQALVTANRFGDWVPSFTLEQAIYTQLPGQFSLSPTGTHAVFATVGRYFGHPVIPDFGTRNNLRIVDLADGATKWLTSGTHPKTNPRFSPDGRHVAYESQNDIWVVDVRTGATNRATLSPSADRAPVWSPDGREIAFVSSRRGGSADRTGTRIWAMSAEGELEGLRLITDGSMGYQDVQWSPTGESLLFTASLGDDHHFSSAIFVVPAASGEPTRITPRDDYNYQNGRWSPDGRSIALLSDKSGFFNIWMMDRNGGNLRPITSEEVEHEWTHRDYVNDTPVWSPDGSRLLYYVNRDGNCDLHTVHRETGRANRLSVEDGCYHPVGWIGNNAVAFVAENYFTPPDLHVRDLDSSSARQVTHSSQVAFRREAFGRFERVSFESRDGLRIHGYLLTPGAAGAGAKLPGLVMLHTYSPGQFYNQFNPIFTYIVESGYVMLQVDQRGSIGYGREFTLKSIGEWGGRQVDDVTAGAVFLTKHPLVDPTRLGVMGYSFGGFQTYWSLIKTPDLFQVGVSLFGPADRRNRPQPSRTWEVQIGAAERDSPEMWERASPAAQVGTIKAPVLIIGGVNDEIVHVGQTYTMAAELEKAQKEFELVMYPNEEHGLKQLPHQLDSVQRVLWFLDRHLKN